MNREFRGAIDSSYDADAGLYYRDKRYTSRKERNDEEMLWGRSNGWVFTGLSLLLQTLPKEHPTCNYYLNTYREMASSAIKCQNKNGSQHVSMLDLESCPLPESSAPGFFVYDLGWGANQEMPKGKKYKKAA